MNAAALLALQQLVVPGGDPAAALVPVGQMAELDAKDRGLQSVE